MFPIPATGGGSRTSAIRDARANRYESCQPTRAIRSSRPFDGTEAVQVGGLIVFHDRLEQGQLVLFRSVLLAGTSQSSEKFLLTLIMPGLGEIAEGLSKRLIEDRRLIFRAFQIRDKPLDIRDEFHTELSERWIA